MLMNDELLNTADNVMCRITGILQEYRWHHWWVTRYNIQLQAIYLHNHKLQAIYLHNHKPFMDLYELVCSIIWEKRKKKQQSIFCDFN